MTTPHLFFFLQNGPQLKLILDNKEYVLSCPVIPQCTHTRSPARDPPLSPGVLQLPLNTDPATTVPASPLSPPSQTKNQEQAAQLPDYHYSSNPGLQYHQLPQVNPSAPQSSHPLQPTISTPPGSQQQKFQYPSGPGMSSYAFSRHLQHPPPFLVQDHFPHQVPKLSNGSSPYNPHLPYHYTALNPTIQEKPKHPASSYHPEYHPLAPYQPAAPVTRAPTALPSPSQLKQPTGPQHQTSPPNPQFPYDPQWPVFHPASHPSSPASKPTASGSSSHPSSQFYIPSPSDFRLPTHLPPAREKPQKPEAPQDMCLWSSDPSCSYYSYPYHHIFHQQHYDQSYPSLPSYPKSQPPVTKNPSTTIPWLSPQTPYLQCLKGQLVVFLPFAHPDSVQVRGEYLCNYKNSLP